MKIYLLLLTLLTFQLKMSGYQYELLLGKSISSIKIDNSEFNINESNYYSISFTNNPKEYYNNYIYFMSFFTDHNNVITKIDIKLISLVTKELYHTLTEIYGQPTIILVPDKVLYDKTIEHKKIKATARKVKRKAKQGTFEDKPTFLIWQKEDFKLEILMKYEQNMSEISFRKTDF